MNGFRWQRSLGVLGGICLWGGMFSMAQAADSVYRETFDAAIASMDRRDYVEAERLFARAKDLAPAEQKDFAKEVDARRAALYIRAGEFDRAVNILRPYVENNEADRFMLSDYLMALWQDKKVKEAENVFQAKCSDWDKMPSYGLQAMGDMYLRAGKYRKAHEIYEYITTREDIKFVRIGNAYALAMLRKESDAVKEYAYAVEKWPEVQNIIAGDADSFLRTGRPHLARQLYNILGKTQEEKDQFRLRYAQSLLSYGGNVEDPLMQFRREERLAERTYSHEGRKILRELMNSNDPDIRVAAHAGLSKDFTDHGLFENAKRELNEAIKLDPVHPDTMDAGGSYDRRTEHELQASIGTQIDQKLNRDTAFGLDYQQYLGNNLYGQIGFGHHSLEDGDIKSHYHRGSAGILYRFEQGDVRALFDWMGGDFDSNGYRLEANYRPNDLAKFTISNGRRPHGAAGAVLENIHENFWSLRWSQVLGSRWAMGLVYDASNISDDNAFRGYGVDFTCQVGQKHNYRDNLLIDLYRSHYRETSLWYDSPEHRTDWGIGWNRKWTIPTRSETWEWLTMLGWGRENDEDGTEFTPFTRIEWNKAIGENQNLAVGAEYHWYAHQPSNEQRRKTGYLLDCGYYIGW